MSQATCQWLVLPPRMLFKRVLVFTLVYARVTDARRIYAPERKRAGCCWLTSTPLSSRAEVSALSHSINLWCWPGDAQGLGAVHYTAFTRRRWCVCPLTPDEHARTVPRARSSRTGIVVQEGLLLHLNFFRECEKSMRKIVQVLSSPHTRPRMELLTWV